MKAIKCPNCGSEQVKELTEEKYACMACDNVFLIHNHSKEFRKTDEHISSMHQDLKEPTISYHGSMIQYINFIWNKQKPTKRFLAMYALK